jgi:hypothetical protein
VTDRIGQLEARIAELSDAHRLLEERLAAVERRGVAPAPARRRPAAGRDAAADEGGLGLGADLASATKNLALAGRTLLVLAGAFLLRALTDAGTLPTPLGVLLGFAYAGVWIGMAWRAGPQQPWSAGFHGLSAILIGFPLLFEATTRFKLLAPAATALTLTFFTAVALAVAVRRRQQGLAWLVEVGGIFVAVALMIATGRMAPPLLYLVLLGVAALWIGYVIDWTYLRWPVALATDVLMVFLALRAVAPATAEGPRTALLVVAVFITGYLASFATRTLLLHRNVVDFEVVQTGLLLVVGLGGAAIVTVQSGMGQGVLGGLALAFGLATYAVAFAFVEHRQKGKANFYFYGTVALVFVLSGSALLLSGAALALGWAALALVAAALARARLRLTLAVHAAVYGVAAALDAGLLRAAATTLFTAPGPSWPRPGAAGVAVVAAMAAAAWLTSRVTAAPLQPMQRIPRCALVAALALAAAGVVTGWAVPLLAGDPTRGADAGIAATVRTAVLVGGVLLLAWAGRREAWREAGWLAYPLLVVIGLKLLLEDLSRSRPASLFLAFALYGGALILVPRLRRRDAPAVPQPPPAPQPGV